MIEFAGFNKISRLSRDIIVTEKIDGTNAQVYITEDGDVLAGCRTRWVTLLSDNFGFAAWVEAHKGELLLLGPGRHFGEWWGHGIQRGYGQPKGKRRFSLFNTVRWCRFGATPDEIKTGDPRITKMQDVLPECCDLVPEMYRGPFSMGEVESCLYDLATLGSMAAPGFMNPEGVVVYHTAGKIAFKKTLEGDDEPKGRAA